MRRTQTWGGKVERTKVGAAEMFFASHSFVING